MQNTNVLSSSPTGFSFERPLSSYSLVQRSVSKLIRNRRFQLARLDFQKTPYLNLGCGKFPSQGFVNLDFDWFPGVNLCWDISGGIPIPNSVLDGAFSEHCLEHLPLALAEKTCKEMKRILKPGAIFRLVLPDAEKYLNCYQRAKQGEIIHFPYSEYLDPSKLIPTPMMMVNHVFRSYGHQYAYDEETLRQVLGTAGFKNITTCEFQVGANRALLLDQSWRKVESIYLESVA